MTEKRYFLHKHLGRDVIHDSLCHNWLKGEELEEHMNVQYTKYSDLKNENEQLKKDVEFFKGYREDLEEVVVENEQLKQQINELQYNKSIGQQEYQKRLFE